MGILFRGKIDSFSLRTFINAISTITDLAEIQITKEGLRVRTIDSNHVAMLDFLLHKKLFEDYSVIKEDSIIVDVFKVKEYLDKIDGMTDIHFSNKLLSLKTYNIVRTFVLPNKDVEVIKKLPEIKFESKIILDTVKAGEFITALEVAEKISSYVKISTSNRNAIIEACSDDENDSLMAIVEGVAEGEAVSYYTDYIVDIMDAMGNIAIMFAQEGELSKNIEIEFGNNKPIRIVCETATFLLAPYLVRD